MSLNKKIALGIGAFVIGLSAMPTSAFAFSYTQIHSLWQDPTYISNSAPDYLGPGGYYGSGYFYDPTISTPYVPAEFSSYQQMCDSYATAQGYTDATDFYCVYSASIQGGSFGTPCFGTACSPGSGSTYIYKGYVRLYTNTLTQRTFASLRAQMDAAWAAWYGDTSQPAPQNPVVCPEAEVYSPFAVDAQYNSANATPSDRCNIYHHTAVPSSPPGASLTAAPSTIVQGDSSLLTYSCTGATTASLNNGIGSVNPAGGSVAVSPSATTEYTLTCTNATGSTPASATVTVNPVPLVGSCSVAPTSIMTGQAVTWSSTASGGTGVYTYSWSGTDGIGGATQSITPSYSTAGTKTASVTIMSGVQSILVPCSNSLSVTPAPQPDLTAGATTPSSGTAGSAVTFSAPIQNIGTGASAAFPTRFQIANASQTVTIGNAESGYQSLGSGASGVASASYNFGSAGSYSVRACANQNSAGTNIVTESNYGNNCGAWTTVSVAAAAPPSMSCVASPSSVNPGDSVSFTATPSGGAAAPYTWLDSDGWTNSSGGTNMSRTYVTPGTYSMRVRASNTGYTYCSNNVSVASPFCAGPASVSISASPDRVKAGNTSTITWNATNVGGAAPSCTISGPGVSQVVAAGALPSCQIPNGSASPTITRQSTYTITCTDGASRSVTVNVVPEFIEF